MANRTKKFHERHRKALHALAIVGLVLFGFVMISSWGKYQEVRRQRNLEPFYSSGGATREGNPGDVIRSEPITLSLKHGSGRRMLYRSERSDGSKVLSSGMVFIPNGTSTTQRPVVAWAHGTIGMGDECAPSRLKNPIGNIAWVDDMLAKGWVVAATDYAGLGTEGVSHYLVGEDEARDVLNSVRAARAVEGANAGVDYVVWGHSQGGHSALFTGSEADNYAPELNLKGVVASAPAAELVPLLSEQYNTALDWVIGPEIMVSWPNAFKELQTQDVLSNHGKRAYEKIANLCIESAAKQALIRKAFKEQFFSSSPINNDAWRAVAVSQTAPVLDSSIPLLVAESLSDQVVLPNTTALYISRACTGGSNIASLWLDNVNHVALMDVISPTVIAWVEDRFAGRLNTTNTCQQNLPIEPATTTS